MWLGQQLAERHGPGIMPPLAGHLIPVIGYAPLAVLFRTQKLSTDSKCKFAFLQEKMPWVLAAGLAEETIA